MILSKKFTILTLAFAAGLAFMLSPLNAFADNYGDKINFNIDKDYDATGRSRILSTLVWAGDKIYFYADDQWWSGLSYTEQSRYNNAFQSLNDEFSKNIYPKLTSTFGSDVNPQVNKDGKITILVHPMIKDAGGYFNSGDGYLKFQTPTSNEREMVYMNNRFLGTPLAKAYLAHEFTHLITFNQKDRLRNVSEDVWLNEARADYASTILGYDNPFESSNFEQRATSFLSDSGKSTAVWLNKPANYGAAHLLMQYIIDHYGMKIITDSMDSDETGINSINYALEKNNFDIDFNRIYRNWIIALLANDCGLGSEYCYKYSDLRNYNIAPRINYLPSSEESSLSVMYNTTYYAGNWQKIIGGGGNLSLEFSGTAGGKFSVPYLLCYSGGSECKIGDLQVGEDGKGILKLDDFGRQYASLTLMPFASGKTSRFNANSDALSYSFKINIAPRVPDNKPESNGENVANDTTMAKLLAQIEYLKVEINRIKSLLANRVTVAPKTSATKTAGYSCKAITSDLYYGVENYPQVKCLQEFLGGQGYSIYPNGAVTGIFSVATKNAVIRFQEKYSGEILVPVGLQKGTGYVGSFTRSKINSMLAI